MFFFFHPRPPSRKEVATQVVARETAPSVSTNIIIVDAPIVRTPPLSQTSGDDTPDNREALQFSVSYNWREYLSVVREHVAYILRQKRRTQTKVANIASAFAPSLAVALILGMTQMTGLASPAVMIAMGVLVVILMLLNLPVMMRFVVAMIGLPIFMLKRKRMPVCDFTIDDEKIVRVTAMGTCTVSWLDVVSVSCYTQAYLLSFKRGAMPIPYRCLTGEKANRMRSILAKYRKIAR